MNCARACVGRGRIAGYIEIVGQQAPAVHNVRFELQGAMQRGYRFGCAPRVTEGDAKLEPGSGGVRLFAGQRLECGHRNRRIAAHAVRDTQQEPRLRMAGYYFEDFARLIDGERGIPLSCAVCASATSTEPEGSGGLFNDITYGEMAVTSANLKPMGQNCQT